MKKMLEQIKKPLEEMMMDSDDKISSKRAVGVIALLIMIITWVANLWYNMTIDNFIFDGFLYIVIIALSTSVAEKFTRSNLEKTKSKVNNWRNKDNKKPTKELIED